ncbi:unnamed protein product, partial [Closterium sp. Naga37s-1]
TFAAHTASVKCVSIGRKTGERVITGGDDKKLLLWSTHDREPLLKLSGNTSAIESALLSRSEDQAISGVLSGSVKLWDLNEGKAVRTLTGHRGSALTLDFHPFEPFFASGSQDCTARVWDPRQKEAVHTLKNHGKGVACVRFSPDGQWLMTGGQDSVIKLWDVQAGKVLHEFKHHHDAVTCLTFHPHELLLASCSSDRTCKFWDLETFELVGSTGTEASGMRSLAFTPDGQALLAPSADSLKVWGWEPVRCFDTVSVGWSKVADVSIHGGRLYGASFSHTCVSLWHVDLMQVAPFGSSASESTEEERSLSGTTMGLPLPASPTTSIVSSTVSSVSTPVHSRALGFQVIVIKVIVLLLSASPTTSTVSSTVSFVSTPVTVGGSAPPCPTHHLDRPCAPCYHSGCLWACLGLPRLLSPPPSPLSSAPPCLPLVTTCHHCSPHSLVSLRSSPLPSPLPPPGATSHTNRSPHLRSSPSPHQQHHHPHQQQNHQSPTAASIHRTRHVSPIKGENTAGPSHKANAESTQKPGPDHKAGSGSAGGGRFGFRGGGGGVGAGVAGGGGGGESAGVGSGGGRGRRVSVGGVGEQLGRGAGSVSGREVRIGAAGGGGRGGGVGGGGAGGAAGGGGVGGAAGGSFKEVGTRRGRRASVSGGYAISKGEDFSSSARRGEGAFGKGTREEAHALHLENPFETSHKIPRENPSGSHKIQAFLDAGGVVVDVTARSARHRVGEDDDDGRLGGSDVGGHQSRKIQEFLDAGGVTGAVVSHSARRGVGDDGDGRLGGSDVGGHQSHKIQEFLDAGGVTAAAAADRSNKGSHACAGANSSASTAPGVDTPAKAAAGVDSDATVTPTAAASVPTRVQPAGVSRGTTQAGASASSTDTGVSGAGGILGGMSGFGVTFDWSRAVATAGGGAGSRAATVVEAMNKVSDWIGSFSGLEDSLGGGGGGRKEGERKEEKKREEGGEKADVHRSGQGKEEHSTTREWSRSEDDKYKIRPSILHPPYAVEVEEGGVEGTAGGDGRGGSDSMRRHGSAGERPAQVQSAQMQPAQMHVPQVPAVQGRAASSVGVAAQQRTAGARHSTATGGAAGGAGSVLQWSMKVNVDEFTQPSLPSKQQKQQQEAGGDEEDDEMVVMESVNGRHTAMQHMLQGRLSAVRHVAALWVDGELLPALSALAASKDLAVVADVLEVLAMQGGRRLSSVGMEGALQLQPLLRALLASSHSKYVGVALSLLRELLRAFSEPITAARTATHSPGVDLHMEERELLRAFSEPITAARTAAHSPGVDLHMEESANHAVPFASSPISVTPLFSPAPLYSPHFRPPPFAVIILLGFSHVAVATSAGFKIFRCADLAQPVPHLSPRDLNLVSIAHPSFHIIPPPSIPLPPSPSLHPPPSIPPPSIPLPPSPSLHPPPSIPLPPSPSLHPPPSIPLPPPPSLHPPSLHPPSLHSPPSTPLPPSPSLHPPPSIPLPPSPSLHPPPSIPLPPPPSLHPPSLHPPSLHSPPSTPLPPSPSLHPPPSTPLPPSPLPPSPSVYSHPLQPHLSPRELHLASIAHPTFPPPSSSSRSSSSPSHSPLTHHPDSFTHTHALSSSPSSLTPLGTLSFLTIITAVRLNHSRLLVLLESRLSVHDVTPQGVAAGFPLLLSLTVAPNPNGICALSPLSPRSLSPSSSCFCAVPAAPPRPSLLSLTSLTSSSSASSSSSSDQGSLLLVDLISLQAFGQVSLLPLLAPISSPCLYPSPPLPPPPPPHLIKAGTLLLVDLISLQAFGQVSLLLLLSLPLSLASLASFSSSTSSDQGTLLIVDLISLQAFGQIRAHDGPLTAIAHTPARNTLTPAFPSLPVLSPSPLSQIKAHDGPIAAVEITSLLPTLPSPTRQNEPNLQGDGEGGGGGEEGGEGGEGGNDEGGRGGGGWELLASASAKGTVIRVHCIRTGNKLFSFRRGAHPASIFSISFSPPGSLPRSLALTSSTGTAHIFHLPLPSSSASSHSSSHSSPHSSHSCHSNFSSSSSSSSFSASDQFGSSTGRRHSDVTVHHVTVAGEESICAMAVHSTVPQQEQQFSLQQQQQEHQPQQQQQQQQQQHRGLYLRVFTSTRSFNEYCISAGQQHAT